MLQVPTLETPRLTLRGYQLSDFDASCAMWNDPQVIKHIRDKPFTSEESWARIFRHAGQWALFGFGEWALIEKETGEYAGEIGFMDLHRDLHPPAQLAPEIGWILCSRVHGKGYATEAVQAALAWFDKQHGSKRTACIIDPPNTASINVAKKCGYRQEQQVTYHDKPLLLFAREP
ncbi:MAG TPA: GNAT family N-acetyltransferase [Candidatus Koribacter sp.]